MILNDDILKLAWAEFKRHKDPWTGFKAGVSTYLEYIPRPDIETPELVNGDLRVNLFKRTVHLGEEKLRLSPNEYNLLRVFISNLDRVLSHKEILVNVWGSSTSFQSLRVVISSLRKKIEKDPKNPKMFMIEWGFGYGMKKV